MKVYIGSDHAGIDAKQEVKHILRRQGIEFEDMGAYSRESTDYPILAKRVTDRVSKDSGESGNTDPMPSPIGILICGSGTGMQIAANKQKGIRAAFCYDVYGAKMARLDNNANILTLRAREFDFDNYESIVMTFLTTNFSGEERHKRRIAQLK